MFTAFGFVFPFLPLYIAELGVGDVQQVEVWSGLSSFGQAMVLATLTIFHNLQYHRIVWRYERGLGRTPSGVVVPRRTVYGFITHSVYGT